MAAGISRWPFDAPFGRFQRRLCALLGKLFRELVLQLLVTGLNSCQPLLLLHAQFDGYSQGQNG